MLPYIRVIFPISVILFISCQNQSTDIKDIKKPYPHTINISEGFRNDSQIRLSDIADSIRYIVLAKDSKHLLGRIRNIQVTDSYIYLLSDNLLMRFDQDGRLLNSFGSTGRGPEEYLPGSVYTTTPDDKEVIINRSAMDSYLIFKADGICVKTRDFMVPRTMFDFKSLSDSVFLCTFYYLGTIMKDYITNSINWSAGIFDTDGNPLKVIEHPLKNNNLSESETRNIVSMAPSVTFFDNRAVVMPAGDTIYEIDSKSISKGFIIDWGNVPHKQSIEDFYFRNTKTSDKVSIWSLVLETYNKLFFRAFTGDDIYLFEYDKVTGSTRSMKEDPDNPGFVNDLDGGINYFPYYTNRKGDIWVIEEDAYSFIEKHSVDFPDNSIAQNQAMKEKLTRFHNSLKEDDNPILIILYLKK